MSNQISAAAASARESARDKSNGRFSEQAQSEPTGVALGAGHDPVSVVHDVLVTIERDRTHLFWFRLGFVKSLEEGEKTHRAVFQEMLEANHGGRCSRHKDEEAKHSPERYCDDCHLAFIVEARINPKPEPVPVSEPPVRPGRHFLRRGEQLGYEDLGHSQSKTTSAMSGDEKFHAAARALLDAPADAEVKVEMEEWQDWSTYTGESSTSITVTAGDKSASFEHMGALMKALDQAERPDVITMAMRFMQAVDAPRPLLHGPAAVYLNRGEYQTPEPVFGKVLNVFSQQRDPQILFIHMDGRKEFIYTQQILTIEETDQSAVYEEG